MGERFQFSLSRLLAATAMVAGGLSFLLSSTGQIGWFALMTTLAGASFGAAVGCIAGRVGLFTFYGSFLALAFVAFAWVF